MGLVFPILYVYPQLLSSFFCIISYVIGLWAEREKTDAPPGYFLSVHTIIPYLNPFLYCMCLYSLFLKLLQLIRSDLLVRLKASKQLFLTFRTFLAMSSRTLSITGFFPVMETSFLALEMLEFQCYV